jgi:fatty acid desaturase
MSSQQRHQRQRSRSLRAEWPTLAVAVCVYGGFALTTYYFQQLPILLGTILGGVLLAWHGSLQHETIHGHPFASRRLNSLLGSVPLGLLIPYPIYRRTHLFHHRFGGRILTEPYVDPESFYLRPGQLAESSAPVRWLRVLNTTLVGRLLFGPLVASAEFLAIEARQLASARGEWRIWGWHLLGVALVLAWVVGVCHIHPLLYLACFVYPGQSLTLLRSFAEHRANPEPSQRTAVVEANALLSLVFLYNNLHVVHHAWPSLPWYRLPAAWREMKARHADAPARSAGLVYGGGYLEIAARYLIRPVICVEHPAPANPGVVATLEDGTITAG